MPTIKKKNRYGLTLIEMVIAIAAASVVLLATASILAFGEKSWDRGWQQATLQRDASFAMLTIKKALRSASQVTIDASGNTITIFNPNGTSVQFWLEDGQDDLKYRYDDGTENMLLENIVDDVAFEMVPYTSNAVRVTLELKDGPCEAALSSSTLMRNYASGT